MSASWLNKYDKIIDIYLNKKKYNEENILLNSINKPEITENDLLNKFIQTGINLKKNVNISINNVTIINNIELTNELYKLIFIMEELCIKKYNYNFNILYNKCRSIFEKKNTDYGDSFVDYGVIGILVRLGDKFNRINSLIKKENVNYESIDDTIIDSFNYIILALMLI
tara:strand:+ start:113 stop:619 length:507 start_codon:yes stop_codon:yes gene_type:complete